MASVLWTNPLTGSLEPVEWTDERIEYRIWTMDLKAESPRWVEDPKSPMAFEGGWVFASRRALREGEDG